MVIATNTMRTINFYDIHSHIIFGVDDGARSLEESIKLLKQAKACGIKKIVCTPHFYYDDVKLATKTLAENFNVVQKEAECLGIKLITASENLLTKDLLKALMEKRAFPIGHTNYVLVELKRDNDLKMNEIISLLEELMDYRYQPIMAHPELIDIFYKQPKNIAKIKDLGVLIQVNASSLTKYPKKRKYVTKLIRKNLVDIVASDAHHSKRSYVAFNKACIYVLKKFGDAKLLTLFRDNPQSIIEEDVK